MTAVSALITGLAGPVLSEAEAGLLREVRPCGLILFARNCVTADQIRQLIAEARAAIGHDDVLVAVDQEGGRVQRLRPPLAHALPTAAALGRLHATAPDLACAAAEAIARLTAADLRALGFDTNCTPVADVPVSGAHDIIGDRAYGDDVASVVALAAAVVRGHLAGGVLPVVKHIPGHGRALADSHLDLPVVSTSRAELSATDFATFRALAHVPAAMTAHVVYGAIDGTAPATTSPRVIADVIRGEIGFDGLLMSDDLSMRALSGTLRERAERAVAAGCDVVLHCNGDLAEMTQAAAGASALTGAARDRLAVALAVTRGRPEAFDVAAAEAHLAALLAVA